jgi:hypothetical protein
MRETLKIFLILKTRTLNKIASMVPVLKDLSQKKANVDDVAQVYKSVTNTLANLFTVRIQTTSSLI